MEPPSAEAQPVLHRRDENDIVVELQDVWKSFGEFKVLQGMSFAVARGTTYVIMGGSGSGKSVTLKHIIGVIEPDRGRVLVEGQVVHELDHHGLMAMRKKIGYLFQSGALINWMSIYDNVALPLRENTDMRQGEIHDKVMEVCEIVDLAHSVTKFPSDISGGMKKRAGLARTLVTEPEIVLYDEPNAGLDPVMSDKINDLIVKVQHEFNVTSIVVTHKRACAFTCGDIIALISDGRVIEQGPPDIMRQSETPLVRAFLGTID